MPGFSITFLLLGVLLGVSLGFLDERDWGTLDRLRTTPTPLGVIVLAKLSARFAIGLAQMCVLFTVGRAAFGVSLGRAPWALVLPTAGIVFAGTAFGLVVAGVTQSREAVLPIGSIAILTMAAMGGCWWPLWMQPDWMRMRIPDPSAAIPRIATTPSHEGAGRIASPCSRLSIAAACVINPGATSENGVARASMLPAALALVDQLAPTLKPLNPRLFDITSPEQFRKALATVVAEISTL